MLWLTLLRLLAAALAAATTAAASDVDRPTYALPPAQDDCAVVVGVEDYQGLLRADFAERDAAAVREHLLALGYPAANVLLVTGKGASRSGVAVAVESWLPAHSKQESTVFFYFAGLGAPDPMSGAEYLVPADGDPARLDETSYPLARLYARLSRLRVRHVVVVLDAGFAGEDGRSVKAPDGRRVVTGAAAAGVPARVAALTAGTLDQGAGAAPDQGHGLFTYYLLKTLNARAGKADLRELRDGAAPEIAADAAVQKHEQTPQLFAHEDADLSLR